MMVEASRNWDILLEAAVLTRRRKKKRHREPVGAASKTTYEMSAVSNRPREDSMAGAGKACSGRKESARLTATKSPRLTVMGRRWKKSSEPAVPKARRQANRVHLRSRIARFRDTSEEVRRSVENSSISAMLGMGGLRVPVWRTVKGRNLI